MLKYKPAHSINESPYLTGFSRGQRPVNIGNPDTINPTFLWIEAEEISSIPLEVYADDGNVVDFVMDRRKIEFSALYYVENNNSFDYTD